MFIIDQKCRVLFLNADFIQRYALPPNKTLLGRALIDLLSVITMSDKSDKDYKKLEHIRDKVQNHKDIDDIIYKATISHKTYKMTFRKLIDGRTIGHIATNTLQNEVSKIVNVQNKPDQTVVPLISSQHSTASALSSKKLPRILVVDDSAVNREVAGIFLSPDFPDVQYANNGQEALDILSKNAIDIVLMDVHMPVMNGVEATLSIRESPKPLSNIIIIALTADTEYQHRRIYQNIGMNDAIPKPIRQDLLIRTILKNWNTSPMKAEVNNMRYMSHL